ncbi:hypothetical protein KGM_202380 [Danaus plexippus plexippus]|uniref:Uncharacterized protein n=1 Tax=Danaus plexippus plexippus TaxID=278856 RepID=A0A212EWY9_DANPL|nr:hypothetical protein KGM_202380 [Danaus plexippus plexippus]
MSPLVHLTLSVYVLVTVAGSVIKVQEVSLTEGESINIKLRKDPLDKGKVVADMRIHFEDEKKDELPKKFHDIVKDSEISGLVNRFAIRGNGRCPSGQKRRGPICV